LSDETIASIRRQINLIEDMPHVSSLDRLKWCKYYRNLYIPVCVCDEAESDGLFDLWGGSTKDACGKFTWNTKKKVLLQAITFPLEGVFLWDKTKLLDYYDDSAKVGKDHDKNDTNDATRVWNAKMKDAYLKGRNKMGKKKLLEGAWKNIIFAERLLEEVKKRVSDKATEVKEKVTIFKDVAKDLDKADKDDECSVIKEPRTQATSDESDAFATTDRKNERITPGDVILYYDSIFPAGDKRGKRTATVIAVDPRGKPKLRLSNSDALQDSTQVCRIKVLWKKNKKYYHVDHPGVFRPIVDFKLTKKELSANIDVGFRSEGERAKAVIQQGIDIFVAKAGEGAKGLL
jgi:hypothetical protein